MEAKLLAMGGKERTELFFFLSAAVAILSWKAMDMENPLQHLRAVLEEFR